MDDRTMLELAARAVGIPLEFRVLAWTSGEEAPCYIDNDSVCESPHYQQVFWWNPLQDDGDALRLAVKLNMGVSIPVMRTPMADVVTFRDSSINVREKGDDILAATRRAITRAAAEIQLAKESK